MSHFKRNLKQCDVVAFFVPLNNSILLHTSAKYLPGFYPHHVRKEVTVSPYYTQGDFSERIRAFLPSHSLIFSAWGWKLDVWFYSTHSTQLLLPQILQDAMISLKLGGKSTAFLLHPIPLAGWLQNDKINQNALVFKFLANLFN